MNTASLFQITIRELTNALNAINWQSNPFLSEADKNIILKYKPTVDLFLSH